MRRKGLVSTVVCTILVIALIVALGVTYFVLQNFVILDWQIIPKHQPVLDLRDNALTVADYDTLLKQIPESKVIWSVPFQGGYVQSDVKELTVSSLNADDVALLPYMPSLKIVHAGNCKDYPVLAALYRNRPDLRVEYTVEIGSDSFESDSDSITLHALPEEDIDKLEYLPDLKKIDAMQCPDYANITQVVADHPEWKVSYYSSIAGTKLNPNASSLELTGAQEGELSYVFMALPNLRTVKLHDPVADGAFLLGLREANPNVSISWDVTIEGQVFADDITELDLSYFPIGTIERAKEYGSKFPQLEKLILDSTDIENEDMAAYREEMRSQYKVVWTVWMSNLCKARTDDKHFMPIQQGEWYFQERHVYNLRYCEEMECIDLGHSVIETVDFLYYMPHLKYLILAHTKAKDITPISNCKELVFLELDHTLVTDYTPLQGCTGMEDLNLGETFGDIEPVKEMTWLKNLWWVGRGASTLFALEEALPDTHVNIAGDATVANGWRNLPNYFAMRDALGERYMTW